MKNIGVFLLMMMLARGGAAQESEPKIAAPPSGLKLELTTPKSSFPLGEMIPITMRYSTTIGSFRVTVVTYDRSGRIADFGFSATDEKGQVVRDPTPFIGSFGGLRGETMLMPALPYEQTVALNEWRSFDKPGHYLVRAVSGIVNRNYGESYFSSPLSLQSEPIALEITAPDEAARRDLFERAAKMTRFDAPIMRELRFVQDERALPFLWRGLFQEGGNAAVDARFGLEGFPKPNAVKTAAIALLNKGDLLKRPRDFQTLIYLLARGDMKLEYPTGQTFSPNYQKAWELILKRWETQIEPYQTAFWARLEPKRRQNLLLKPWPMAA